MSKSNEIYLHDILEAIEIITEEYVSGFTFKQFEQDKKTQDAVIRQIAIIGEAFNKLGRDSADTYPDLPIKEAVAMRNVLVHNYDWVDTKEVWNTIKSDLPKLRKTVTRLLK